MDKIIIRPMTPEDWGAVSRIYVEGIATEYATFQTECPPYTAWDASHTKECRLVILSGGVLAGWCALHRVDPRWCYRGVAEVSIYVGEQFRGHGLGFQLLSALCAAAEKAGYWTLQSTVLQDNTASRALHAKCGFRLAPPQTNRRGSKSCNQPHRTQNYFYLQSGKIRRFSRSAFFTTYKAEGAAATKKCSGSCYLQ